MFQEDAMDISIYGYCPKLSGKTDYSKIIQHSLASIYQFSNVKIKFSVVISLGGLKMFKFTTCIFGQIQHNWINSMGKLRKD